MNAILSFSLPDDCDDFTKAVQAPEMHGLILDLVHELRSALKYGSHPNWDPETVEGIQSILSREINDRGITLWQ